MINVVIDVQADNIGTVLREDVEEIQGATLVSMRAVLEAWGKKFLNALMYKLSLPGSGRVYPSKTGHGKHVASKPGEAPSPDRREYMNSWNVEVIDDGDDGVILNVASEYWGVFGRRLELGGADYRGITIAPRPHLRPVIDAETPALIKALEEL